MQRRERRQQQQRESHSRGTCCASHCECLFYSYDQNNAAPACSTGALPHMRAVCLQLLPMVECFKLLPKHCSMCRCAILPQRTSAAYPSSAHAECLHRQILCAPLHPPLLRPGKKVNTYTEAGIGHPIRTHTHTCVHKYTHTHNHTPHAQQQQLLLRCRSRWNKRSATAMAIHTATDGQRITFYIVVTGITAPRR